MERLPAGEYLCQKWNVVWAARHGQRYPVFPPDQTNYYVFYQDGSYSN
jgi:hypothetical protein